MKLGKNRCQCRACGLVFTGVNAFDWHRYGPMEARQCKTPEMLRTEGIQKDKHGAWTSRASSKRNQRGNQHGI